MMLKRRGIFLALGLAVITASSLAGGAWLYLFRLPDPATADQRGLLRWLVTRDLSQEPVEIRHTLVKRFEAQIHAGARLGKTDGRLSPDQERVLRSNVELLLEDWFRLKAAAFHALPRKERIPELDRQIDSLQNSGVVEQMLSSKGSAGAPSSDPMQLLTQLHEKMQNWVERSRPEERAHVQQFAMAVQGRILMRALQSLAQPKP